MEYNNKIASHFATELADLNDPLQIIMLSHLSVEHGINYLIFEECKEGKALLKDRMRWTFSMKLQLVYQLDLIPDYLFDNIMKLNKIRNEYAHNLSINLANLKINLYDPHKRLIMRDFKGQFEGDSPKDIDVRKHVFGWIGILTFGELNNLILSRYYGAKEVKVEVIE